MSIAVWVILIDVKILLQWVMYVMDLSSIGGYIRKYRLEAGMSQNRLAELTGVSTKYVGVLERSEKPPSLETLINIANALDISADMLLCDVLDTEVGIKQSLVGGKISGLPRRDQLNIIAVLELLVEQCSE